MDPRSCPKLVFPAQLEEPGAGLLPVFSGLSSSHPSGFPAMSRCNQLFPAQGPRKSHHKGLPPGQELLSPALAAGSSTIQQEMNVTYPRTLKKP